MWKTCTESKRQNYETLPLFNIALGRYFGKMSRLTPFEEHFSPEDRKHTHSSDLDENYGIFRLQVRTPVEMSIEVQPKVVSIRNLIFHQFLSISYWSYSEYWSQTSKQNDGIHSTKLDVYAVKQSAQNLSYVHLWPLSSGKSVTYIDSSCAVDRTNYSLITPSK